MIPVVQQRVDIRKTLMERELGSKITYYEILQLLVEQQEELGVQNSQLHEAEAAVAAIRETRGAGRRRIPAVILGRTHQGRTKGRRADPGSHQSRAARPSCSV